MQIKYIKICYNLKFPFFLLRLYFANTKNALLLFLLLILETGFVFNTISRLNRNIVLPLLRRTWCVWFCGQKIAVLCFKIVVKYNKAHERQLRRPLKTNLVNKRTVLNNKQLSMLFRACLAMSVLKK